MQNISLGDYKGGRDTLQTAMGMKYDPLDSVMASTAAFAKEGLGNAGSRELYKQHDAATLQAAMIGHQNAMELEAYKDAMLSGREDMKRQQIFADENEVLSGEEEAALAHANHVFSLLSPEDQKANLPWLMDMHARIGTGSVAKRKGRMGYASSYNLNDPFAQITATAARAKRLPNPNGQAAENPNNRYDDK